MALFTTLMSYAVKWRKPGLMWEERTGLKGHVGCCTMLTSGGMARHVEPTFPTRLAHRRRNQAW
jgi:hypothetical protein